eukprot:709949-Rhodomonas_salina.1
MCAHELHTRGGDEGEERARVRRTRRERREEGCEEGRGERGMKREEEGEREPALLYCFVQWQYNVPSCATRASTESGTEPLRSLLGSSLPLFLPLPLRSQLCLRPFTVALLARL